MLSKQIEKEFKGIFVSLLTPFDKKENVDEDSLRKLIRFLLKKQVDGLYLCGSAGEGLLLTGEERRKVTKIVLEEAKGKNQDYRSCGQFNYPRGYSFS